MTQHFWFWDFLDIIFWKKSNFSKTLQRSYISWNKHFLRKKCSFSNLNKFLHSSTLTQREFVLFLGLPKVPICLSLSDFQAHLYDFFWQTHPTDSSADSCLQKKKKQKNFQKISKKYFSRDFVENSFDNFWLIFFPTLFIIWELLLLNNFSVQITHLYGSIF